MVDFVKLLQYSPVLATFVLLCLGSKLCTRNVAFLLVSLLYDTMTLGSICGE